MGEDYTGSSAVVFERVLTSPPNWIDYSDMEPSMEDITSMSRLLVEMGLWQDMPADVSRLTDTRFVRKALATEGPAEPR